MSEAAKPPRIVKCPTCAKEVVWGPENPQRPFCSERCRQIDLGAWASDVYRVEGESPLDNDADPLSPARPPGSSRH